MVSPRYDRQIILKEFGEKAQKKLSSANVLLVGAGGLGTPILQYLNSMGVGHLGIIDQDVVHESNLHRQVIYTEKQIGVSKVRAAKDFLISQNSHTKISIFETSLTKENAIDIILNFDVVVDASDNFPTRYLVNDACVILNKPFVYGALHEFEGQISVFNHNGGPTYRCLFSKPPKENEIPNCNTQGVLGILPGIVGSLQALECVKIITGIGKPIVGSLLIFNALKQQYYKFKFPKKPENIKIYNLLDSYQLACETDILGITPKQFKKLIKIKSLQIIDVREPFEVKKHPLQGAINIPLLSLMEKLKDINLSPKVYFICQSGARSLKAVKQYQKYFPNNEFISLQGGLNTLY